MSCAYFHCGYELTSVKRFGESNESRKICRFCGKSIPDVSFKKTAHAISENIGNKFFISNEECDNCNDYFSKIEEDFYRANALPLSYLDIKGKHGSRKIKLSNGEIYSKNGIWIIHPYEDTVVSFDSNGIGSLDIILRGNALSFTPCNIYKALVKFLLAVLNLNI